MSGQSGGMPVGSDVAPHAVTRVVAVGSSAGGLEALEEFLSSVKHAADLALVVVQHLAPDHPSLLVDLLSRSCSLSVREARDGGALESGTVLVAPPGHDVRVAGMHVIVTEPPERFGPSPSIDLLMESLAKEWGASSVGIVLSGTGSDGAVGLRSISGAGGLCLVQSPGSAAFDGMPRAAISLGAVDFIGSPSELGAQVSALSGLGTADIGADVATASLDAMATIVATLRRTVGIDFGRYKASTMQRQVQRRMAIRRIDDVATYSNLLLDDGAECEALEASILVTVTSFFRDAEAFEALKVVLRDYVQASGAEALRIWVPGCATGEEVYSIGMLVGELLGFPTDLDRRMKIFGTDVDETSLEIARRATYPVSALNHIPEALRDRYVKASLDGFRIAEVLRECTVFARHDLTVDPPFPQIDVVSCRNTLIYFTDELQADVLGFIAFALKPTGVLFLGRAEDVTSRAGEFEPVDPEHRIFLRTGERFTPRVVSAATVAGRRSSPRERAVQPPIKAESVLGRQVQLLEAILRRPGEAHLVLDSHGDLIHVIGDVSRYCVIPEGPHTSSFGALLRPELQAEARALLLLSRADRQPITGQPLTLDESVTVRMSVRPLMVGDASFSVVSLHPDTPVEAEAVAPPMRGEDFDRELLRLERELQASQEVLHRSLAELQAANEELEATAEELQASMEELQSANEELQAANEELQATNEELATINQEQRERSDELERLNLDLRNIQNSTNQGMVLVDRDRRVRRYTPMAVRAFALTPGDIGNPIETVPTSISSLNLVGSLDMVIDTGEAESIEVATPAGHFLLQVLPYRDADGTVVGAILALTDVSEMANLRDEAQQALVQLRDKSRLLQRQATVDELTGVSNRAYFAESLAREMDRCGRASERLALLWIDLDHFKEVNDGLGHEAGDITLRVSAERLGSVTRITDVIGRLGGDEFGVVLIGPENLNELEVALERIVGSVRDEIEVPSGEVRVSASVGVALYPDDARDAGGLLRAADAAMYAVKATGGDGYAYFDRSMNEQADSRRSQRDRIARAIRDNEFRTDYQPIISVDGGRIWGVEALLRWQDGQRLVDAAEFIDFAEESGQIRALGESTLRHVRDGLVALRVAGHPDLRMAVNMSVTQLEDESLIDSIGEWADPVGAGDLVVEIVESIFLPDHRRAMESLGRLVGMGAVTSVDDFGAGYSNYRLLKTLSPHYIKLDRSFLSEGHGREERLALLSSAVSVAHVIGAQVIAEGIEDDAQWELVREANVDFIQGYRVARAMPIDELLIWLAER